MGLDLLDGIGQVVDGVVQAGPRAVPAGVGGGDFPGGVGFFRRLHAVDTGIALRVQFAARRRRS